MTQYIGLLDGQIGVYGVTFPDLPGYASGGATADEADANAIEAVSLWIENALGGGDDIRYPRTLDEIRADREVIAEVEKSWRSLSPWWLSRAMENLHISNDRSMLAPVCRVPISAGARHDRGRLAR